MHASETAPQAGDYFVVVALSKQCVAVFAVYYCWVLTCAPFVVMPPHTTMFEALLPVVSFSSVMEPWCQLRQPNTSGCRLAQGMAGALESRDVCTTKHSMLGKELHTTSATMPCSICSLLTVAVKLLVLDPVAQLLKCSQ